VYQLSSYIFRTNKGKHGCSKNKKIAMTTALVGTAALALHFLPTSRINASDHIDSPTIAGSRASYGHLGVSRSDDKSKVVLMMSTQGFIVSGEHFGMLSPQHPLPI